MQLNPWFFTVAIGLTQLVVNKPEAMSFLTVARQSLVEAVGRGDVTEANEDFISTKKVNF